MDVANDGGKRRACICFATPVVLLKLMPGAGHSLAVPDMQNEGGIVFDREQDPVDVRVVSVEQLPDLEWEYFVFRSESAAVRAVSSEAMAWRRPLNQRSPASPACCARSHCSIVSRSRFALAEALTREIILRAHLFEGFVGGLGATGLRVVVALPNAFDRLLKVLPLPLQGIG